MKGSYARLILVVIIILAITGCDGDVGVGPGMTFDPPSKKAIMLRPPTAAEQANQGKKPWCAPAAALTLYRVVTGKNEPLDQVAREMGTTENGTSMSNFVSWMNNHSLEASSTMVRTTWAIEMIKAEIKQGFYVAPHVNENAKPNSPHVFIVYGVDGNRVLVSDSNRHLGMNQFGIDLKIFQDQWLTKFGDEGDRKAFLVLVNSRPRRSGPGKQAVAAVGQAETLNGDILVK